MDRRIVFRQRITEYIQYIHKAINNKKRTGRLTRNIQTDRRYVYDKKTGVVTVGAQSLARA
jgi:hypothetical protein